jgi:hypothetical protein
MQAYNTGEFDRQIWFPREYEHPRYGPNEPAYVVIGRWDLARFVPPLPGSQSS